MAINISTLFADIIDTPEQRQEKLLQQGMAQGQLLASGLTGRARALAPLAQMAGQLGVQRNEDLRRAVQPMLGIDPRTTGEKLQETLAGIDTSTPQGLLQAAQVVQAIDPLRAATLRQAAAELTKENAAFALSQKQKEESITSSQAATARGEESLAIQQRNLDVQLERLGYEQENREYARERDAKKDEQWQLNYDLDRERIAQNSKSLSVAGQKAQEGYLEIWQNSSARARKASRLADRFASYAETGTGGRSGAVGRGQRAFATFMGAEDPTLLSYAELEEIRASNAIQLLPKGPASDRDINLVLRTQLSDLNSKEDIESYLRGIAKAQAIIAESNRRTIDYIGEKDGQYGGYIDEWEKMQRGEDSELYTFAENETFADYMNKTYDVNFEFNKESVSPAAVDDEKDIILQTILSGDK